MLFVLRKENVLAQFLLRASDLCFRFNLFHLECFHLDCCSQVQLKSVNTEDPIKALGVYNLKGGSIIKNRPVYVEEESGSHLLFGMDGWKVN